MDTLIFGCGLAVFVMVAAGLALTVGEFKRIERGDVPKSARFPL
ncbi:MAG: hypothetical protein O2930_09185 [Acidobacteria bacterium]|nr:hypothetical protein [Acidobacteriota bacterium]